jgi:hypothetical protein
MLHVPVVGGTVEITTGMLKVTMAPLSKSTEAVVKFTKPLPTAVAVVKP